MQRYTNNGRLSLISLITPIQSNYLVSLMLSKYVSTSSTAVSFIIFFPLSCAQSSAVFLLKLKCHLSAYLLVKKKKLNLAIGLIYVSAQMPHVLLALFDKWGALCVATRCGQKRWRNVMCSVCACFPPWALDDSHSDTRVAGMEWSLIAFAAEHQPLSSLGVICILCPVILGWKILRGKRMEQVNDPEKLHLRDMKEPEWERCLSGAAGGTWL